MPPAALDDLVIVDAEPTKVGARARQIGATSIAPPAFAIEELPERVRWARALLTADVTSAPSRWPQHDALGGAAAPS